VVPRTNNQERSASPANAAPHGHGLEEVEQLLTDQVAERLLDWEPLADVLTASH